MLKPLGDRVILEVEKEEEKTVGGIVLAGGAKEKPQTAKVVAVGTGRILDDGKKLEMTLKVGDVDKYAGAQVEFEGQEYLVMHEKDILAVVE